MTKVLIRFENDDGTCSEVGMSNLMIVDDRRIKTKQGILNRVNDLITLYHLYRTNKVYRVYDWVTDKLLFKGKNDAPHNYDN